MEIKVGQWVRTKDNYIFKLELFHIEMHHMVERDYFTKVADTPQELVNIKTDLICGLYDDRPKPIIKIYCRNNKDVPTYQVGLGDYIKETEITKIFTPNANGDFIKQWESTSLDVSE